MDEGVTHCCVTNVPGAVPRTSTLALTNATLPYAVKLANLGVLPELRQDAALSKVRNTHGGHMVNATVASLGLPPGIWP